MYEAIPLMEKESFGRETINQSKAPNGSDGLLFVVFEGGLLALGRV